MVIKAPAESLEGVIQARQASGRRQNILLLILLTVAVVFFGEEFNAHIGSIENWLKSLGPWGIALAIITYALCACVFIPDTMLGILAGAALGMSDGLVVATGGSLLAASIQYILARHLLRPIIYRKVASKPVLLAFQSAARQAQFNLQVLVRLTPINRALASYVFSAAGVTYRTFLAACIGFVPHLILEVYIGYAGRHLVTVSEGGGQQVPGLHQILLLAGSVMAIVATIAIARVAGNAVKNATQNVN